MNKNMDLSKVADYIIESVKEEKLDYTHLYLITHESIEQKFNFRFKEKNYTDICTKLLRKEEVKDAWTTIQGYLLLI